MTEQFVEIRELLLSMLNDTSQAVVQYLPKLVGAAVVLLLWFWFSSIAVILGAELNEALALRPWSTSDEVEPAVDRR